MKFGYGQRVKCVKTPDGNDAVVGMTGIVRCTDHRGYGNLSYERNWVGVEFDADFALGHSIEGCAGLDHYRGWYCPPDCLIPAESAINIQDFI